MIKSPSSQSLPLVKPTAGLLNRFRFPEADTDESRLHRTQRSLKHLIHLMLAILLTAGVTLAWAKPSGWYNGLLAVFLASALYLLNLLLLKYRRFAAHWGATVLAISACVAVWFNIFTYVDEYPLPSLLWVAILAWFAIMITGYKRGIMIALMMIGMFLYYHIRSAALFQPLKADGINYILVPANSFLISFGIFLSCSTTILALFDYRRSHYENKLAASELKRRLYIEQTNMAVIDCDVQGIITGWNSGAQRMFGYGAAEVIGKNPIDVLTAPEDRPTVRALLQSLPSAESIEVQNVNQNVRKDGQRIVCAWANTVIRTASGQHLGYICSAVDITEQIEKEQELQMAKEAAEGAAKAKGAFLANMSHEIRTPMNGIIGLTNLLLTTDLDQEQHEYVGQVHKSAAALLNIINEILDFSKIESGKLTLDERPFDLYEAIHDIFSLFMQRERRDEVALVVTIDPVVPHIVKGDAGRLRQILVNLIGNAIKFTTQGSIEVVIHGKPLSQQRFELQCTVSDTGIGIPEEKLHYLFESFTQADVSTTRQYGGTGLGLAISKALAQQLGGTIHVRSQLGVGSTFCLTVPLTCTAIGHRQQSRTVFNPAQRAKELIERELPQRERAAPLAILLVEDNPINQKVATRTLEYLGFAVDIAENGIEAVDAVSKADYDVVFMDIQMPQMDGLEATRQIRQLGHQIRQPRIIAMTAAVLEHDKRQAHQAGMDDLISKPIRPETLARKLIAIVQRQNKAETNHGSHLKLARG